MEQVNENGKNGSGENQIWCFNNAKHFGNCFQSVSPE
jgi:hypothetical protein